MKITVFGTGAANARFLAGDSKAPIKAPISAPPVVAGAHGKAWRCDVDEMRRRMSTKAEEDGTLDFWIVEAPSAHPMWHSYLVGLVHLRPLPDGRATHLKQTTVDMATGKVIEEKTVSFGLMPAAEGTCPDCAVAHDPAMPHNAQSLFYQYRFCGEHNRWPTWADAIAHCSPELQADWKAALQERGAWTEPGKAEGDQ